jgi:hypothetical protein
MNIHTSHATTPSPDDELSELERTAAHHFEPWVRGREQPMTPANLMLAAEGNFMAIYFAYECHFKTKAELIQIASKDEAADEMKVLFDSFESAREWLKLLSDVLRGAQLRLIISGAAAVLEMEDAA